MYNQASAVELSSIQLCEKPVRVRLLDWVRHVKPQVYIYSFYILWHISGHTLVSVISVE